MNCLNFKASQKGVVISDIIIFILAEGDLTSGFFTFYFILFTNPVSGDQSSKECPTLQCLYNILYKELKCSAPSNNAKCSTRSLTIVQSHNAKPGDK